MRVYLHTLANDHEVISHEVISHEVNTILVDAWSQLKVSSMASVLR